MKHEHKARKPSLEHLWKIPLHFKKTATMNSAT